MEVISYLLGSALGLAAFVCLLILMLCWPILTLWGFFRILKDVRRIADALEGSAPHASLLATAQAARTMEHLRANSDSIVPSAFGR